MRSTDLRSGLLPFLFEEDIEKGLELESIFVAFICFASLLEYPTPAIPKACRSGFGAGSRKASQVFVALSSHRLHRTTTVLGPLDLVALESYPILA